jgi:hypothetical protein
MTMTGEHVVRLGCCLERDLGKFTVDLDSKKLRSINAIRDATKEATCLPAVQRTRPLSE